MSDLALSVSPKQTVVKSKHGRDVFVAHGISRGAGDLHEILIVGTCGGSMHQHIWGIGAVDGLRPDPPTTEELQKRLDELRQQVADEASWKEGVRLALDGLR